MATHKELIGYIRFQLEQLNAHNKHHDFEHLCREFARLRICENILPATGPVSAGGDQGRDFETYRSYLESTPIAESTFIGKPQDKKIVFACSLEKKEKINTKIKSDLKIIFSNTIKTIDSVYYFCVSDIPAAKRHKLQLHAYDEYNTELEIFDGQALSQELAKIDVFWIAQEYLSIPSEMFPKEESSQYYQESKEWWEDDACIPWSYADFNQIKNGLRTSVDNKNERPDILFWLEVMEKFLNNESSLHLKRLAMYEIIRASLKGQDNLSQRTKLVEEYFSNISAFSVSELEDCTCLLNYCATAHASKHFDIEAEKLVLWASQLILNLETALKNTSNTEEKAYLLMLRGLASVNFYSLGSNKSIDINEILKWWQRAAKVAKKTILFSLERFENVVNSLTRVPTVAATPAFKNLVSEIDKLLMKRTEGFAVAEKCLDRVRMLYDSGQYVLAIKSLHQCKVHWFAAETLKKCILAMMSLTDCYRELGLIYAAKYYAAASLWLINRSDDKGLKLLLPDAFFLLLECCYMGGEWLYFTQAAQWALSAHNQYDINPLEPQEHQDLARLLGHLSILRAITKRFDPNLAEVIESLVAKYPIDQELQEELNKAKENKGSWIYKSSVGELLSAFNRDLCSRPFSDLGAVRKIEWKALGITWQIEFQNEFATTLAAEELVATVQIIIADLSVYDLFLLPTQVKIFCEVADINDICIDNATCDYPTHYKITLSKNKLTNRQYPDVLSGRIFSFILSILNECSALSSDEFMKKVKKNMTTDGLIDKTFMQRPYSEYYNQVILPQEEFNLFDRSQYQPLNSENQWFAMKEHKELTWKDTLSDSYSWKKAKKFLTNRYKNNIKPIKITLSKMLNDESFKNTIKRLKNEGFLDWQILQIITDIVTSYRLSLIHKKNNLDLKQQQEVMVKLRSNEETSSDIEIPSDEFCDSKIDIVKNLVAPSAAKTWGLIVNKKRCLDMQAIKKFLDVRYRHSIDDIEHKNFWGDL